MTTDAQYSAARRAEAGHELAVLARPRVILRRRVLKLMAHVDPALRPDRDHRPVR
ncbi:hypothetical protein [Propionivibrio sp.]|uniref:hypothetical protein n=1 Tax=Propionivibrio sp. TaxID=2212460 RepID=UPI0025D6EA37|nr:hypothetical protein [Propionivibrio sp.]